VQSQKWLSDNSAAELPIPIVEKEFDPIHYLSVIHYHVGNPTIQWVQQGV
jgi:hypothetical protein